MNNLKLKILYIIDDLFLCMLNICGVFDEWLYIVG